MIGYNLDMDSWPRDLLDDLNNLEAIISKLRSERDNNAIEINNKINKRLLISQVYNSNAIEGNAKTLNETEMLLENSFSNAAHSSSSKDEIDVISLGHATKFLQELITAKADLDERAIKDLHALTISKDHHPNINPGAYRKENVRIANSEHEPPNYLDIEEHMSKMFQWKRKNSHIFDSPLIIAAVLHHWFTWIHPFSDGNGRTGRLFLNFYLSQVEYPQLIIRVEDRDRYYDSLNSADKGDIIPLVELLSDRLRGTIDIIEEEIISHKRSAALKKELDQIKQNEHEKLINQKKIEYQIWKSNLNVFKERFKGVLNLFKESLASHNFNLREYDIISFEKYISLLENQRITNDWFMTIAVYDYISKRKVFIIFKFKHHSFAPKNTNINNSPFINPDATVMLSISKKDEDTGSTASMDIDNKMSLVNVFSFKDQLKFGVRTYVEKVLKKNKIEFNDYDNYHQMMEEYKRIREKIPEGRYKIKSVTGSSEQVISDFIKEIMINYFDFKF